MKKQYDLDELVDAIAQARETIGRAQTLEGTMGARQAEREAIEAKIAELQLVIPRLRAAAIQEEQAVKVSQTQRMEALERQYAERQTVLDREMLDRTVAHTQRLREMTEQADSARTAIATLTRQQTEAAAKLKDVQTALVKIMADMSAYKALVG